MATQTTLGKAFEYASLQEDSKGIAGDVRDVICIRKQNQWEIGLSCKHNHSAVKHSRLSPKIDFGEQWFGIPCSAEYFKENSSNTINITCDGGWAISMRIHNASSKVETSLKFDVGLIGVPPTLYTHFEPWM